MDSQKFILILALVGFASAQLPWGRNGDSRFPVRKLPGQNWNHNGKDQFGLIAPASVTFGRNFIISGGEDLFGVRDEVWSYDLDEKNLFEPTQLPDMYSPRSYHTAEVYRNYLFTYGDVHGLELQQLQFGNEHLTFDGPGPVNRIGHASIIYDEAMYVYGGYTEEKVYSDELWKIELKYGELHWELVQCDSPPRGRAGHSAILYQDSMYIYGGEDSNGTVLSDLWRYDFLTASWVRVYDYKACKARGVPVPDGRQGHAAVYWADEGMWIWGGMGQDIDFLQDMWRFDLQKEEWTQIYQNAEDAGYDLDSEDIPAPRAFFAYDVSRGQLVVTGGLVGIGETKEVFWSPKTRFVPIIHGNDYAGDVWEFDFNTRTWHWVSCLPPWNSTDFSKPSTCRSHFKPQCENDCNGNGVCVRDNICICRGQWTGETCSVNICHDFKYLGYDVDLMDRILIVESILNVGKNLVRLRNKLQYIKDRLPPFEEFTTCVKFNPVIADLVREQASTDGLSFNQDVESSLMPVVEEFNQVLDIEHSGFNAVI